MSKSTQRLLTEDIAGIDITDRQVFAARIKVHKQDEVQIQNAGWVPLPEAATEQEIATEIRRLWRKCRLNTYSVCSCFRSRKLAIRRFEFADVDEAELSSTLSLEAESLLRIPAEAFFLDWQLDASISSQPNRNLSGTYVVAPREEVDRHVRILKMAGLTPTALDIPQAALCNLYAHLCTPPRADQTMGIINISAHTAEMVIINHALDFHSQTLLSLNDSWEENIDYLVQNVSDVREYVQTRLRLPPLADLRLTGHPEVAKELCARIKMMLPIQARTWDPVSEDSIHFSRRGISKEVREAGGAMLATSIGTALRRYVHASV